MTANVKISTINRYGPLQEGFGFDLAEGYRVLVGRNNSGKSAILQLVFRALMREQAYGPERVCLLPTVRDYVQPTTETGGSNLQNFNTNIVLPNLEGAPLNHSAWSIDWSQLPRLLLNHTDTLGQIESLKKLLAKLGLPELILRTAQLIHFENVPVALQGSGLRSVISILAALTDTHLSVVLIDEPELSLEPDIQRVLRDILVEASSSKRILVATHSHLLLNRDDPSANLLVQSRGGIVSLNPIASREQLYDITFQLLGNSLEDLFFPHNFMFVEGSSDQIITERVRDLLNLPTSSLKILSASGVDNVPSGVSGVARILIPVVTKDSPYANKVVALIDQPPDAKTRALEELERMLGNRLFVLNQRSIEEYIPEEIYTRIGRNKSDDLAQIAKLRSSLVELFKFKKELSQQIAAQLNEGDLENLPTVVAAVRKATE